MYTPKQFTHAKDAKVTRPSGDEKIIKNCIVTGEVTAYYPYFHKRNRHGKYGCTIKLSHFDGLKLHEILRESHEEWLTDNPEHAEKPFWSPCKKQHDGSYLVELQNKEKPEIVGEEHLSLSDKVGDGSVLKVVAEFVPFPNNPDGQCGISLRLMTVEILERRDDRPKYSQLLSLGPSGERDSMPKSSWDEDW